MTSLSCGFLQGQEPKAMHLMGWVTGRRSQVAVGVFSAVNVVNGHSIHLDLPYFILRCGEFVS